MAKEEEKDLVSVGFYGFHLPEVALVAFADGWLDGLICQKSIRIYTKDYGKNHPYTLVARMNRVLLWRQTGKFEKAKAELTELLAEKKRRDGTGRESIETARCRG